MNCIVQTKAINRDKQPIAMCLGKVGQAVPIVLVTFPHIRKSVTNISNLFDIRHQQ